MYGSSIIFGLFAGFNCADVSLGECLGQPCPPHLLKSPPPPPACDLSAPRAHGVLQDIPKLVFRASGELHIAFSTGHVQTIWLRGEVSQRGPQPLTGHE